MRSLLVLAAFAFATVAVHAEKATVCTVTVNSADEREAFRRYLPEDRYQFVELVEHGRPDWLASACERKVKCDVLVVSGHFAGNEFYSSRVDVNETLPVDEMERVACSDSCPDLFSQLKEVYLFGCDSLKPEAVKSATPEIVRGLVREGHSRAEAEDIARALSERHAESSRARMRRVFSNVPVIYGFSSLAPYGRIAGPMLDRYFQADGEPIGTGQVSPRLLALFAPASMVVTRGQAQAEPNADYRAEACRYYDDRISTAQRVDFMHELMGREMPEVRIAFDRIEKFFTRLTPAQRAEPAFADSIERLGTDRQVRSHYLGITRATQDPALRLRMIALASSVGWLAPAEQRAEQVRLVADLLASDDLGFSEVDLVCGLNDDHALDDSLPSLGAKARADSASRAAALACLGHEAAHARVVRALASSDEREVQIAQAYLRHRPMGGDELRAIAASVAGMKGNGAQVRALETLARQHIADREVFGALKQLYVQTRSPAVQRAIAEIFLRAGAAALDDRNLAGLLRQHRVRAGAAGDDLVDVLIRRLQASQPS